MNLYDLPEKASEEELFELLWEGSGVVIERIVSYGQVSPPDFWYDQERDEWVVLIQGAARLRWDNDLEIEMEAGDYLFIPARARHRVEYTSSDPPCIWLAVHVKSDAFPLKRDRTGFRR